MNKYLYLLTALMVFKAEAQSSTSSVADSLYLLGNYTAAINAYAGIGDENSNLQIARAYNAIGDKEKAILQYQDILKKNNEHVLAKFELGKLYDKTKKYKEAIKLFQELAMPESTNPEFYYYLGKSHQSNLDYDKGNSALKKVIELDSTHLRSIYLLGKYYVGVEEPANAMEIIDLGLKTAPNDVALINLKALANFDAGYYEKAAPLFARLVELGEKKPFVYKKLGYSYANRWKYEEAKKAYRKLGEMVNYEADAYEGLGQVYLLEKELDSAEIYFLKSIDERRYIFDNEYRSLGRIARLKGQLKKSLDYYTKAWEEDKVNQFNYWQVCILADEYYKDPKIKLRHYEKLLSDFDNVYPFLKERAKKRITELKEEIHFNSE
ncbi:tetratricopeptide repeat protein [Croceitalea marina]|uniref:Tetratricopeptide repeat protein n=1 Tax=Croceitalea marina TaxID=1775166 RepID=A0ABW5N2S1_9FLAO